MCHLNQTFNVLTTPEPNPSALNQIPLDNDPAVGDYNRTATSPFSRLREGCYRSSQGFAISQVPAEEVTNPQPTLCGLLPSKQRVAGRDRVSGYFR